MAATRRKVIISCAVTGSVHTPSMSPYLPATPDEIARQAMDAAKAGAAILHLHARDPADGSPTPKPEAFELFISTIAAETNAIINITTGGSTRMSLEERLAYPLKAKPELCSLNMGSMNFVFHHAARGTAEWKHPWEKAYIEGSEDRIFRNTFRDIAGIVTELGQHGTRFELECYDVGQLYTLAYFVDEHVITPPLFIQCILGLRGGLSADPENLFLMRSTADRLFGRDGYEFSVLGAGRHQMALVTMGAIMGGHVRVGLEDSLYLSRGVQAPSNAAQVEKIRRILEELSLEIATPDEARQILQTKGRDRTGFAVQGSR